MSINKSPDAKKTILDQVGDVKLCLGGPDKLRCFSFPFSSSCWTFQNKKRKSTSYDLKMVLDVLNKYETS